MVTKAKTTPKRKLKAKPKPKTAAKALNDRHLLFIARYMIHGFATRAYGQVYPDSSVASRDGNAHKLMMHPLIRAEIDRRMQARRTQYAITAERLMDEAGKIALANPLELYGEDGRLLKIEDTPLHLGAAIKSRYHDAHGERVEMHDKMSALNFLGRCLGMFKDKVELKGDAELLQALREGRARSEAQ